jgi:hypothetical protein
MPGDQDLQAPPWVMRVQPAHIPAPSSLFSPKPHSINWEQPEAFNRNVLSLSDGTSWTLGSSRE